MRYIVIVPAYNEAAYLPRTLDALVSQNLLPQELIVVNDGSTDQTGAIIDSYAQKYAWIKAVHNTQDKGYEGEAKIVAAFYRGFDSINEEYDFLAKIDADIEVDPDYFGAIANIFIENPDVGLAGGILLTEKANEWVYENISDRDHVKGAFKAWRKAAFVDINGLRPTIGWDSADEILIQYHGWQVKVDESLPVRHYRPLGTQTGLVKIRVRIGYSLYRLRYGFWISLISSFKAAVRNQPFLLSGLAMIFGYLVAWWRGDTFAVTEEEGQFIRQFRWQRMLKKIKF
jgi:glycosyltransferase involved in cell wall biosynthesis